MSKYISINEASVLSGKHANTIRKEALRLKGLGSNEVQIELLKNGVQKLYISRKYILNNFVSKKVSEKSNKKASENSSDFIEHLKNEVEYLRKQNEHLTTLLAIEKQEKQNLIEQPKKRGWLFWRR
jgi:hypothetical protein